MNEELIIKLESAAEGFEFQKILSTVAWFNAAQAEMSVEEMASI